jgi:hypothetical protein
MDFSSDVERKSRPGSRLKKSLSPLLRRGRLLE